LDTTAVQLLGVLFINAATWSSLSPQDMLGC